jgi:hypothetical protein
MCQKHVSPSLRGRRPKQSSFLTMTYGLLPASGPRSRNDEMGLLTQPHIRITNDKHAYVSHLLVFSSFAEQHPERMQSR